MVEIDRPTLIATGIATTSLQSRKVLRSVLCRVMAGADAGKDVLIGLRPFVVGAGAGCDLVLKDPKVSRQHAELSLVTGGILVRDLDSTNGVISQGTRISQATVPIGASVQLGDTTLRFVEAQRLSIAPSPRQRFGGLLGESVAMREIFAILELAGPTDATVLLEGESGTGKEVAARAIHDHSGRAAKPFVIVDCGAAKEQLIESDFFGHVKGAFTGAVGDRKGAFVQASGGTVFLDEIGELPLPSQAKLLRVLENHTLQPLGSDQAVTVDARVIAATNRDLAAMVADNTFRFDLFHRLAVVHIQLPALRERFDDLPCLIRSFYEGRGIDPGPITGENLARLQEHGWPGNVRELRNVLERAWVLSGQSTPSFSELRLWLQPDAALLPEAAIDVHLPFKEAKEKWVGIFEQRYIAAVYERFEHNISRAAKHADINRRHFRTILHKHGLGDA
jgi:DNA-binding NtrC family response regulator